MRWRTRSIACAASLVVCLSADVRRTDAQDASAPSLYPVLPEDDHPLDRDAGSCVAGTAKVWTGGESREYLESYHREGWGAIPDPDRYLLQRYGVHADAHACARARVYVELRSELVGNRPGGPRPSIDKNALAFDAFAELVLAHGRAGDGLIARYGREQLDFGAGRIISSREGPDGQGPNVLASFDGLQLLWQSARYRIHAFAEKPVVNTLGAFTDYPDHDASLTGIYATRSAPSVRPSFDVYGITSTLADAVYARASGEERRTTAGARIYAATPHIDYDVEVADQFGHLANEPIAAYEIAANVGSQFGNAAGLRLGVQAGIASGERAGTTHFTAFSAPFSRGFYFGLISLLGPTNIAGVEPNLAVPIGKHARVELNDYVFWSSSRYDGLYGPSGRPVHAPSASGASFLGNQPEALVHWTPTNAFGVHLAYSHFFTGSYFASSTIGSNVDYFAAWTRFRL